MPYQILSPLQKCLPLAIPRPKHHQLPLFLPSFPLSVIVFTWRRLVQFSRLVSCSVNFLFRLLGLLLINDGHLGGLLVRLEAVLGHRDQDALLGVESVQLVVALG